MIEIDGIMFELNNLEIKNVWTLAGLQPALMYRVFNPGAVPRAGISKAFPQGIPLVQPNLFVEKHRLKAFHNTAWGISPKIEDE